MRHALLLVIPQRLPECCFLVSLIDPLFLFLSLSPSLVSVPVFIHPWGAWWRYQNVGTALSTHLGTDSYQFTDAGTVSAARIVPQKPRDMCNTDGART